MKMKSKNIAPNVIAIKVSFRREKLNQVFRIQVNSKIAEVFKNETISDSSNWKNEKNLPIKFYSLKTTMNRLTQAYISATGKNACLDDYGSSELNTNFSILRSVDIQNGINWVYPNKILNDEDVKNWITGLAEFTKWVYLSYVQVYTVKAVIKFNY